MDSVHAILLGIVEGLTEFLPISSTGHLILVSDLLGLPETEFLKSFEIVIQLGAILAVVMLYWRRLLFDRPMMQRIVVALFPALGVGYIFYKTIRHLLDSELTVVIALFLGGIFLIVFEYFRTGNRISAQAHLQRFYGRHGFVPIGEPYLEDTIPHIEMWRSP